MHRAARYRGRHRLRLPPRHVHAAAEGPGREELDAFLDNFSISGADDDHGRSGTEDE